MFQELDFSSDNASGIHPRVLDKIAEANHGNAMAYGLDRWTMEAKAHFEALFHEDVEVHFLWSGTATNVLALKAILHPHEAVLCGWRSHLYEDETGAAEQLVGCKLIPVEETNGKISPEGLAPHLGHMPQVHQVQPRVISITQQTERGTVYTLDEIRAIAELAKAHNCLLHMDGARIANAAAALGVSFKAFTMDLGVDILSFGGSKNGLMGAEALVFLTPGLADHFGFLHKQGMQLTSKMRFLAAQYLAYFEDDLWHHNATHANAMAQLLKAKIEDIPHLSFVTPVDSNALFVRIPEAAIVELQQHVAFHRWDPKGTEVRWMTSWNTREEEVLKFAELVREVCEACE